MNKKTSKKSSEKQFIKTMIITGVIGLSIMMITMLYVIKVFGTKKVVTQKEVVTPITTQVPEVVNVKLRGIVHGVRQEGENIKIWDIKSEEYIEIKTTDQTGIKDGYGKPMTVREIQVGEVIEVTYDTDSKVASIIQKSSEAWSRLDINDVQIDNSNKTITIGNEEYNYTSNIIITNPDQEITDIDSIGKFDTLAIKGIGKTIWSIQIMQSPGYINLLGAPTTEGTVEIDNNRIYMLADIKENIPLAPGMHKVVIQIKGYEAIVENINITKDTIHNIDLKNMKQSTSTLSINVTNTATTYTIQINNKRYKKGDRIELPSGEHTLKVTANEFEPFEQKIELEPGEQLVEIVLVPKEIVIDDKNKEKEKEPKEDKSKENEFKTVQIIIETDPVGAQVFVNGVHKGTTPTLTGLKPGEYNISIEKEGYEGLNTIIVVDGGSSQRAFLYTLQKE